MVDVGTNSTRLLVAEVADGRVRELDRRTIVTRLGEGVDAAGRLSEAAMERVSRACAEYRKAIDEAGAERVVAMLTSAVRDAANGAELERELERRFGFEAQTISGEREARLTYLGATSARHHAAPTLVLDIGGGSTEVVVGAGRQRPVLRVDAARLGAPYRAPHPHRPAHAGRARRPAARLLAPSSRRRCRASVREQVNEGIAVAGTPTSFAAIELALDPYDPERVEGHHLTLAACERILGELAALPLAERRLVTGLHPDRAPTIVAGGTILVEAMRLFDLDEIEVSERDILHGAALEAARDS